MAGNDSDPIDDLVRESPAHGWLRDDDPDECTPGAFYLYDFWNGDQVVAAAQALHGNERVARVEFNFGFDDNDINNLNWGPLLQEIETREKLEDAVIHDERYSALPFPTAVQFFQALRENANLRKLQLCNVIFTSDIADAFVAFVEKSTPLMTNLHLSRCRGSDVAEAEKVANALKRNNRLQLLSLDRCETELLCIIFQSLASQDSLSVLKSLLYHSSIPERVGQMKSRPAPPRIGDLIGELPADYKRIGQSMNQYLESDNATIQRLELKDLVFGNLRLEMEARSILYGLSRNTSVTELGITMYKDRIPYYWQGKQGPQERVEQLADLVRNKQSLQSICFSGMLFGYGIFSDAIVENLNQRNFSLRCLEITGARNVPSSSFRAILSALTKNGTRLERFILRELSFVRGMMSPAFVLMAENPLLLKVKNLTLSFEPGATQEDKTRLLQTLASNFSIQSLHCENTCVVISERRLPGSNHERNWFISETRLPGSNHERNWFSGTQQERLESIVNRNKKLAAWTMNPRLVPRELWSYAMGLALKAGINSLFQSLVELSGFGIGLKPSRVVTEVDVAAAGFEEDCDISETKEAAAGTDPSVFELGARPLNAPPAARRNLESSDPLLSPEAKKAKTQWSFHDHQDHGYKIPKEGCSCIICCFRVL